MKHTQGNWEPRKTLNIEEPYEIISTSEFTRLAIITNTIKSGEPVANANLIAAAPDMLEVLRKVVGTMALEKIERFDLLELCNNAINKATGGL